MNNEYITEVYFYLDDLKKKRAISSLFNLTGGTLHRPDDAELKLYKQKFDKKLNKISSNLNVEFDFFKSVMFGDNYGPRGSWTTKSCGSINIYHGGSFGEKTLLITKFLRTLDPKIEILARAWDREPDKELWIKSTKDNEFEARNLHFNKNDRDVGNIAYVKGTYDWIENEFSFSIDCGILTACDYKETPYHGFIPKMVELHKTPKTFASDILNLFKKYKLVPDSLGKFDENFDEPLECFTKLIDDYCQSQIISYPQVEGGWVQGQLGEEFAEPLITFCKKTNTIIQGLTISVSNDSEGNEDPYQNITIQFKYRNKLIKWRFNIETQDDYFESFSKWAKSVLNGGYLVLTNDFSIGYILPKEVVEQLESLGIPNITMAS